MKKSRFNILISLMSVALLGLLLLQFFWIQNVFYVTKDSFKEDVQQSLNKTILDMEKIEATQLMNPVSFQQGLQGSYTDFVKSEFGDVIHYKDAIEVRDTTIVHDGVMEKYLVVYGSAIDTATGLISEHRILTKDQGEITMAEVENSTLALNDTNSFAIRLNKSFERQIMTKAKRLNEMVVKMFAENLFDDITFRLNPELLDSVLTYNMGLREIDTNYTYNVVDKDGQYVGFMQNSEHLDTTLVESNFNVLLYPNDIVAGEFRLIVSFPEQNFILWSEMIGTLSASLFLVIIVVLAFYFAVATIYKQKQLSEIKNDFISNMTHELKTPISTISLACEAVRDPDVSKDTATLETFISMIDQENKRLAKLVENVLQTALLDKGKLTLKLAEVRVDKLLKEVVDAFQIQFRDKGGELTIEKLDTIDWEVDRIHFGNIIYNLLDNSLKYSTENPRVRVKLEKVANGFTLEVADNGIGIKKEDQQRIFENLYRVPTGDVHNVKGFGLGLSYVHSIVKLHHGQIDLESALGKGSTFKITINNE
ncbi:MAG: HAMP domain-containing histidine kinase [Flavobacteriales bacterium]|nr:HAMP domain-containing histidine kinase [Flavobacteriales bacterium]